MQNQLSPAPWTLGPLGEHLDGTAIRDALGNVIVTCAGRAHDATSPSPAVQLARRDLLAMAAAVELLDGLKLAYSALSDRSGWVAGTTGIKLRGIIAKAEGRA